MSTYAILTARVMDELDITDRTSQVQLEIKSAIKHYEVERFWFNEDTTKTVTAPSTATLALPGDFLELDAIHIERNGHPEPPLTRQTWAWYRSIGGDDTSVGGAPPSDVVIYDNTFYLYPVPDATYTAVVSYLMQEATLSATSDTNPWCVEAEELIRARSKAAWKINYEENPTAKQEAALYAARGEAFLSTFEKIAYGSLGRLTAKRVSSGRIVARQF